MLEGVITKGDIAKSYMDVYDNTMLAKARTQYRNIAAAVEGKVETGNEHGYFQKGKVAIAASGKNLMTRFIEKDDLVIMGDRLMHNSVPLIWMQVVWSYVRAIRSRKTSCVRQRKNRSL